jgi:hypothetical protein
MGTGTGGIPTTDNIPETTEKLGCPTDNIPETTEKLGWPTDNIPETTEKLGWPTDNVPETTEKLGWQLTIYPTTDFLKRLILLYSFEIKQINERTNIYLKFISK